MATLQTKEGDARGKSITQKVLLICGMLASVMYVLANVMTVLRYPGYSPVSQTVSELSAIGAPTRQLWVSLLTVYSLLMIAFGYGVWRSGAENSRLRVSGILLVSCAIIGFFWPPMHRREVLAPGAGP